VAGGRASFAGVIAPLREAQRKGLHLSTTVIPLALAWPLPQRAIAALLVAMCGVAVVVEVARRRSASFGARFERMVGRLLREHEHARITTAPADAPAHTVAHAAARAPGASAVTGATWLLLALAASALVLPAPAAIAATWAAGVGDALAALAGRAWRRWRPGTGKTVAGSAACLLATAVGAWWLAGFAPLVALAIGAGAALAERPAIALDDNVRVAAGAAAVALLALRIAPV
jgi:hypothetical protein